MSNIEPLRDALFEGAVAVVVPGSDAVATDYAADHLAQAQALQPWGTSPWVRVDLMGRQRICGRARWLAGGCLWVEVGHPAHWTATPAIYGPGAIFCAQGCSEAEAQKWADAQADDYAGQVPLTSWRYSEPTPKALREARWRDMEE